MTRFDWTAIAVGLLGLLSGCTTLSHQLQPEQTSNELAPAAQKPEAQPAAQDEESAVLDPVEQSEGLQLVSSLPPVSVEQPISIPPAVVPVKVDNVAVGRMLMPAEDVEPIEVAAGPRSSYAPLPRPAPVRSREPKPEPVNAQASLARPGLPQAPAAANSIKGQPAVMPAQVTRDVPLVEALRMYMDDRPADALKCLSEYETGSQEILLNLLELAARLTRQEKEAPGNAKETAFLLEQLERLEVPLRPRAELLIDKICFCRRIEGFGAYDPIAEDQAFRPGELVRVYVEVRNFTSTKQESKTDTFYLTQLSGKAEIRDEHGQRVWRQEFQRDRPDQSRALRHDYFDNYRFCLPDMKPGLHTLWIRVTDKPTGRTVERSLDFHVKTAPALGT